MFEKLNLVFPDIDYENNLDQYLMTYYKDQKSVLTYYKLNSFAAKLIREIIPPTIESEITSIDYIFTGITFDKIRPHIDNGVITNINFYLETADAYTNFYESESLGEPTPITDHKATYGNMGGKVYNYEDLSPRGFFKAEPKECWILDVSKIHGVSGIAVPKQRKWVSVMFANLKFEDAVKAFDS